MFESKGAPVAGTVEVEEFPPIAEMNDASIESLIETEIVLSTIIGDIAGEKPDVPGDKREAPHSVRRQAAMIANLASEVRMMARDIKRMISP